MSDSEEKSTPDWQALADEARQGRPGALAHYVHKLRFPPGRQLILPEPVFKYFREIVGKTGKVGRPARSDYERYVIREFYYQVRKQYAFAKRTGAITEQGDPLLDQPSDVALRSVAEFLKISEHGARSVIYGERGKRRKKPR